jgi:adenylate kinase
MNNQTMVIVLLGPPGSGKGTQAGRLAQQIGLTPISTGELLRREAESASDVGEQVRSLLAAGFLVGNDLMNEVVTRRLSGADCHSGCILDGYPRTVDQAWFLDELLRQNGLAEPVVFDFVVSPEQVIERLSQRRQCPACGKIYSAEFDVYGKDRACELDGTPLVRRSDDNAEAIRERLSIYDRNTRSLVEFYKSRRYFAVDALQSPDEINGELMALMTALEPLMLGTFIR